MKWGTAVPPTSYSLLPLMEGTHDTAVIPTINTWYRFIVEVEDVGGNTAIRVKVWQDNTTEPAIWQIDTTDSSSPLTSGTFGLWAYNNGSKYWDDLAVTPLNSSQPTPTPTNTPAPGNTATPTSTPAATSTPTATPDPGQPAVIQRSTYTIAGQAVALRVVEKDVDSPSATILSNRLYYFHTDHLGSTSAMSDNSGTLVDGSTSRFAPFGAYRTEPTADLTDRGFTGHQENRSLGLTYMNARYFVVGLSRFASADTIIPDPANPQSYNRFSYVLNSPLNFTDPTGHDPAYCADQYESQGDPNCNHSYPSLINFTEDENSQWTSEEKLMLIRAAYTLANRMAEEVNEDRAIPDRLSPKPVFMQVFGGSITADKTSQNCTVALDCVAWVNEGETTVNIRQITNPYLFIHEVFHIFDLTILGGGANDALLNQQDNDADFPNRPNLTGDSRERWGFAGGNFSNWQKSRSGLSGEEFADMGIGWTYGQWDTNVRGALTADGQARADFMSNHMLDWILEAIGE